MNRGFIVLDAIGEKKVKKLRKRIQLRPLRTVSSLTDITIDDIDFVRIQPK